MSLLNSVLGVKGYLITGAAAAVIAGAAGWAGGLHWDAAKLESWKKQAAEQQAADLGATLTRERAASDKTAALGLAAAQRQVAIQTVTTDHIREVPKYVTRETDARCIVPVGVVRLHDSAAQGVPIDAVPTPAGKSDGDASELALSGLVSAVVANYGTCQQVRQTLMDLQAYERQRQAAQASVLPIQ